MLNRAFPPQANSIDHFTIKEAQSAKLNSGIPMHWINAGEHDILQFEIILRSGKWYEKANGASFFTSKMLVEGTAKKSSSEISEFFESFGVQVQINPGIDFVSISALGLNKYFHEIIPAIKEFLICPAFPADELNILKDLQIQQTKVNNEKGSYIASKEFRKTIFGEDHPYGKHLEINDIGENINTSLLKAYHSDQLLNRPELILTGKVKEEYLKILESHFGSIGITSPEFNGSYEMRPSPMPQKRMINKPGSLQSSIRYGKKIIRKTHPDYTGLLILNELLGGFFGSRLMKNIREEKGFTYGIHSSVINYIKDSYFVISADIIREHTQQAIEEINKEIIRLQSVIIDDHELEIIRNYLMGSFLSSLETSFSLAEKFKSVYFHGLDYGYYREYINTIKNIKPLELQRLANEYLKLPEFSLVTVGEEYS